MASASCQLSFFPHPFFDDKLAVILTVDHLDQEEKRFRQSPPSPCAQCLVAWSYFHLDPAYAPIAGGMKERQRFGRQGQDDRLFAVDMAFVLGNRDLSSGARRSVGPRSLAPYWLSKSGSRAGVLSLLGRVPPIASYLQTRTLGILYTRQVRTDMYSLHTARSGARLAQGQDCGVVVAGKRAGEMRGN